MALDLKKMLAVMVENEGSDLYLTFEASPSIKTQGSLRIPSIAQGEPELYFMLAA